MAGARFRVGALPLVLLPSLCSAQALARPAHVPEITIDRERMCPLVDGKPFFAIGCYGIPEAYMKEAAEAGFNLTMRWGDWVGLAEWKQARDRGEEVAFVRSYLDAAREAGLWVVEWPAIFWNQWCGSHLVEPSSHALFRKGIEDTLPRVVAAVRDHPALFGYNMIDEPFPEHRELCAALAQAIRAQDPRHPIYLDDWWGPPNWPETHDITGMNYYPFPDSSEPLTGLCNTALSQSQGVHRLAHPYWNVPLMEAGDVFPPLGPVAQRAQTYLALIGGANGLVWWVWPPRRADNWAMLRQLNRELRALSPVLTEPPAATRVTCVPSTLSNVVRVRAIRHANWTWLLTANAARMPATVRFTLPVEVPQRAKVWFEDREVAIAARQFTQRFDPLDRHVYEIHAQWPKEGEIKAEVELDAVAPDPPPTPDRDPLCPNLIADPGFEEGQPWAFMLKSRSADQVRARYDESTRHGGKRCARIELDATEGDSRDSWVGPLVQLKPNRGYTFGGWAKAEVQGHSGKDSVTLCLSARDDPIKPLALVGVDHFGPWRKYSTVCYTPDHPIWVRASCHFFPGWNAAQFRPSGRAWFDDLFLYEQDPGVRTMVVNGGFEGPEVAPGWPRSWNPFYHDDPAPGVVGGPDSRWGLDHTSPYEGRFSLRMVNREKPRPLHPFRRSGVCQCLPSGSQLLAGHDYVLSAYLRTDKPGYQVAMVVGWGSYGVRSLTSEWQRYVLRTRCPQDVERQSLRIICTPGDATVWVDAVQFEEGTEPTEYREWRE